MPALFTCYQRIRCPRSRSLLARHRGWRTAMLWVGVGIGLGLSGGQAADLPHSKSPHWESPIVAFVSEIPYQWQSELGNPLELWARKLSSEWAVAPDGINERLRNFKAELSWERLERTARTGKAEAFVVHGYEFIEHGDSAQLDELLIPTRDGMAAMTQFIILRQRKVAGRKEERKFSMLDLDDREILVDRGGCGELVYRWLDREIRLDTGTSTRDHLAEFHTASSAAEAILAVYFGEAHACVVSRAAYAEATRYNPRGIAAKLEELRASPPLLQHVIACPKRMATPRRKELIRNASNIRIAQADGVWALATPRPEDFRSLKQIIREWQEYFELQNDPASAAAEPAPTPSAQQPAVDPQLSERRGK